MEKAAQKNKWLLSEASGSIFGGQALVSILQEGWRRLHFTEPAVECEDVELQRLAAVGALPQKKTAEPSGNMGDSAVELKA